MLLLPTLLHEVLTDSFINGLGVTFEYNRFSGDSSNMVRLGFNVIWLYLVLVQPVTGLSLMLLTIFLK